MRIHREKSLHCKGVTGTGLTGEGDDFWESSPKEERLGPVPVFVRRIRIDGVQVKILYPHLLTDRTTTSGM